MEKCPGRKHPRDSARGKMALEKDQEKRKCLNTVADIGIH